MIVTQVFLEAMEGCHLFLSPLFVMQTGIFCPSAIVQIFVSPGCKDGLTLIPSSGVGGPSQLSSSVSFHSFRRAFASALQRCSFSSGSQPELLFLAAFPRRLAAGRSRMALKRCSLSWELSLDTLRASRLRSAARHSSRCSLVSLDRLTTFRFQSAARRSSLRSLVSLVNSKAARVR